MNKLLKVVIIVVAICGIMIPTTAFAATTADITITATPSYLAMTNSEATWAIGQVSANTVYWWTADTNAPSPEPFEAADMKSTITNTGSITEDFDIKCAAFTGGVGWTISTDDTPAANEISIRAGITGTTNAAAMIQVITTDTELVSNLAAAGTIKMCLRANTGTFGDGVAKSGTCTLTCRVP